MSSQSSHSKDCRSPPAAERLQAGRPPEDAALRDHRPGKLRVTTPDRRRIARRATRVAHDLACHRVLVSNERSQRVLPVTTIGAASRVIASSVHLRHPALDAPYLRPEPPRDDQSSSSFRLISLKFGSKSRSHFLPSAIRLCCIGRRWSGAVARLHPDRHTTRHPSAQLRAGSVARPQRVVEPPRPIAACFKIAKPFIRPSTGGPLPLGRGLTARKRCPSPFER